MFQKVIQSFKDTYCFIGIHSWNEKWEHIKFKIPNSRSGRTIETDRRYRICTNCYKSQHAGIGYMGNKWFNEDEKEMYHRKKMIRSIKLEKLIRKLS